MQESKTDQLTVRIYKTRQEMGTAVAGLVAARIIALLEEQQEVNMIFAAAPSQNEFLATLSEQPVEWSRVNAFHMDEYVGLAENAPQRFGQFLDNAIFSKCNFKRVFYLNGNAPDLADECKRYADLLDQYPTDIVCMGIGENGHLAFNDPPVANFRDPEDVKLVELDMDCRIQQVNDNCFLSLDKVPTHALTLTIPALLSSTYVYCTVPALSKATAVFNTLNKELSEQYPSTILRTHPRAMLFLDEQSGSLL